MSGTTDDAGATWVLVHGIVGFGEMRLAGMTIRYFRGVRDLLAARGIRCLAPGLPSGATVAERAETLSRALRADGATRYVLVAHSMGGLDGRYLIAHLDGDRRVGWLVTLGTPHRGTPIARWALDGAGPRQWLLRRFGRRGLAELTEEACARRNESLPDRADVRYLSVAAARPVGEQTPLLRWLAPGVMAAAGLNDGLVSVPSARWGDFMGAVPADHFELVGWDLGFHAGGRQPFDHRALYHRIVERVVRDGGRGPAGAEARSTQR